MTSYQALQSLVPNQTGVVAPVITSAVPDAPIYGEPYSHTFEVDGTPPFTWELIPLLPDAPTLTAPANAAVISGFTTTLQWNDVDGATSYEVQIASDSGFIDIVQTGTPTDSEYVINPALNLWTYYWRVRSVGAGGVGAYSDTRTFQTSQVTFTQTIDTTNLVTNGDMETGNPPTGWTATAGAITGAADERTGGAGAQSLDLERTDASNPTALRTFTGTQNTWIDVDAWLRRDDCTHVYARLFQSVGSVDVPPSPYYQGTAWARAENILRVNSTGANNMSARLQAITSAINQAGRFDDYRARVITLNAEQTLESGDVDIEIDLALPVANQWIGQRVKALYRMNGSTYWTAEFVRNNANTNWDFALWSVNAGAPTSRATLPGIGTPDKMIIRANGTKHQILMSVGGVETPLHTVVDLSLNDTATGFVVITSEDVSVTEVRASPSVPFDAGLSGTLYTFLDGDSKTDVTDSFGYYPPIFKYLAEQATGQTNTQYNAAVGGYTLEQALAALPANLAAWPYVANEPTYALVNIGANGAKVEATWKANLRSYIETFHATFASTSIYIACPWVQNADATFATLATWITDVCAEYAYAFVGIDEVAFLKGTDDGAATMMLPYPNAHANGWGSRLTAQQWVTVLGL